MARQGTVAIKCWLAGVADGLDLLVLPINQHHRATTENLPQFAVFFADEAAVGMTRVEASDAAAAEALVLAQHPGARVHAVDATCRQIAVNNCRQVDLGRKQHLAKSLRCS